MTSDELSGLNEVTVRVVETGSGPTCAAILATVPQWFGVAEANEAYARVAETEPTVIASLGGDDVGFLTMVAHSTDAAEVHVMAVRPEHHRQGIGQAMLAGAEAHLVAKGIRFLQVKTLADTDPDPGYIATRAFYRAQGFVPLEVFPTLWDPDNPALLMIKVLGHALGLDTAVALESAVWDALCQGDATADAALLSDDFLGVYPTGFADRADHAGQLDAGPTVASYSISEPRLTPAGPGSALLSYRAHYRRTGADSDETMLVSSLWSYSDGRWRNSFSQDTPESGHANP